MKYHLIGIGGVSMSGLAKLLVSYGYEVSGCDLKKIKNPRPRPSSAEGGQKSKIKIFEGHNPKHITKDLEAVVVTVAVMHDDSPAREEIEKAHKLGIKVIKRSKLIGQLMSRSPETLDVRGSGSRAQKASGNDKIGIAVAGMHGKTTVTTMIGLILEKTGYDPTVLVGSNVKKWGGNVRIPTIYNLKPKTYFVVEACEYERQMLDFRPKIAVITNLEEEHLDTYPGGMKDIRQAFKKFIKLLPSNGLLVVNQDDKNLMPLTKAAKCKVKRFGKAKIWPGLSLKIPGQHNLLNATAAARVCHELGVDHQTIKEVLNNFRGADRRFEIKGIKNGITVIDDYGHHPTEIRATIDSARGWLLKSTKHEIRSTKRISQNRSIGYRLSSSESSIGDRQSAEKRSTNGLTNDEQRTANNKFQDSKLIVVFQPHQYTRTKLLFNDFVKAFDGAGKLIIADIYLISGREPKEARADFSRDLVEAIKKRGVDAEYISTYDKIVDRLQSIAKSGDTILTIGATDIYKVAEKFLMSNS